MSDIRPTDKSDDSDWKNINQIKESDDFFGPEDALAELRAISGKIEKDAKVEPLKKPKSKDDLVHQFFSEKKEESKKEEEISTDKVDYNTWGFKNKHFLPRNFNTRKTTLSFAVSIMIVFFTIGVFAFVGKGMKIENDVVGTSNNAYKNIKSAISGAENQDFLKSSLEFKNAYASFSQASDDMDKLGNILIGTTRFFPVISKVFTGKSAIEAGKHISLAGKYLSNAAADIYSLENPLNNGNISLLAIFQKTEKNLELAMIEMEKSQKYLSDIKIDDLPEEKKDDFLILKKTLPQATASIDKFLSNSYVFTDLLGGNGPRKYLFLFQNNQEMRATGGFIGSYGLLDIFDGKVKKFYVDGIFNPDGQLTENIIPPRPIQKVSAAWSMHDSNWFPDFPLSAKKAILFFEKTGGPTADGIITLTPTVMEKFLAITGPIEMPEYEVTLNSENFIKKTQYEVEVDYDKEENQPKRILSDLAPIILDRIFNSRDVETISKAMGVISEGLDQKHILLYSQDKEIQRIISKKGWSGEIMKTPRDYLSVINTNISGFKTDGVIDESISHEAEIQDNGSIINTVTITRVHNGGNTEHDWWNRVNSNYMRVYVPKGSVLLETEGQTKEVIEHPLDYEALDFKSDQDVNREEESITIDESSGTRIYNDSEKTVFANWTYVSPQEEVVVRYKYRLPFEISFSSNQPASSYSLLVQKQSGSIGSNLISIVKYPEGWSTNWVHPDSIQEGNQIKFEGKLDVDRFSGAVFIRN